MPLSIAFWVLILLWCVSGCWWGYTTSPEGRAPLVGWSLLLFLLLLVLGLKLFGGPIQGG
jgi:hypothetical protein